MGLHLSKCHNVYKFGNRMYSRNMQDEKTKKLCWGENALHLFIKDLFIFI